MSEFTKLYPSASLPDPEKFQHPPVTRRVAQFWFDVSQEEFDRKLPSWIDSLLLDGPFEKKQVKEQWEFRVDIKPGKLPRPKATLTQIPQLTRTTGVPFSLEISPPQGEQPACLKLTQARSDEHPTRFNDFREECSRWLSSLFTHFGIPSVKRLALMYRNEFTRERYPGYWENDESVKLGQLINVFRAMPNPTHQTFEGNFVIDFTRRLPGEDKRTLRFKLAPEVPKKKPVVWATSLIFSSLSKELQEGGIEAVLNELAGGHSLIYEEFCVQYTPEALELFFK